MVTTEAPERLLTRAEVAAIAGISERTLMRLEAAGRGPPSKRYSRKIIRYGIGDVRAWLEEAS